MPAFPFLAAASLGAAYPGGRADGPVDRQRCSTAYRLTTSDPIQRVAAFYKTQAGFASIRLLDDSGTRFADYRTLTFVSRPQFLFVLLQRSAGRTQVRVRYHLEEPPGCG